MQGADVVYGFRSDTGRTRGNTSTNRFMKMIADIAMMIRQACKRGSLLATAGKYIAVTTTTSRKLMSMTSIQNKFLSVEADMECLREADKDEKRRMPD
jgi:hypothetical protein